MAVIDTGVDYNHQDLAGNMWRNLAELNGTPGVDDDGNGYVDDIYGIDAINYDTDPMDDLGHGTHVAGTIGAIGNNGIGVVGVNWNVRIMSLKFIAADGKGYTSGAIECLEYAIMMNQDYGQNIRITSNSYGGSGYSQALYDAIQAAGNADILFIAAAGNSSADNDKYPFYPASYDLPNIIAVAATDHNDNLASFSNWGLNTVHVAAPGVNVYSTFFPFANLSHSCNDSDGDGYGYCSGTSMATPHVSGLAALILAAHPEYTGAIVKWDILSTVDPVASLNGLIFSGGRINANNALTSFDPSIFHIFLLNPDGGEVIPSGSTYTISWIATPQAVKFGLQYSINNGSTWKTIVSKVTRTSYDWHVPTFSNNKTTCLVKVMGFNSSGTKVGEDQSDSTFTIEVVKVRSPDGGEIWTFGGGRELITWRTNVTIRPVASVKLFYSINGGASWKPINCVDCIHGNPGYYDWTVPDVSSSSCLVKVLLKDAGGATVGSDVSDGVFTIQHY